MEVSIRIPDKLVPVFLGDARYRGSHGGRGSAKTRTFAKMAAVYALRASQSGKSGIILCVREFMNSLADSSMAEIVAAINEEPMLKPHFEIGETYIRTACRRIEFSFIGLKRNLNNLKSKARILLCWGDEAEQISEEAWVKLIPTVREDDSEIWVTWNPEREGSPTDLRFRHNTAPDVKIIELNYKDNPWFPAVLERERLDDMANRPENYEHVWNGAYRTHVEGAYFAKLLIEAREAGRFDALAIDPLSSVRAYIDIGGPGARADAFSMWICQFVGHRINVLNYYEAQGQGIAEHLAWLRKQGLGPGKVDIYLPHDGLSESGPNPGSFQSAFEAAGYHAETLRNEGSGQTGARSVRIEAVRRRLGLCWFDEAKTRVGVRALMAYHEKIDPERGIGLGPEHDWASHGADAFGLLCTVYEEPVAMKPINYPNRGYV